MDPDTWPRKVDKTIVTGNNPMARPRKTWLQCIKKDLAVKCIHSKSRSRRENGVVQPSDTGNNAR